MNFRKLLCLGLLILTAFALVACAGEEEPPKDTYYTVTYDSNGGSAVTAQSIKENDKALAPIAPTRPGYDFAGWYIGETAFDFDSAITQNITLTAKWTKVTYTITYKDGDTTLNLSPASYDIETDTFNLPEYSKTHYTFLGWYTDANSENQTEGVQKIEKGSCGNITLYAKFVLKRYTVTYEVYGGTNAEGNPSTYNLGTVPFTLANPTKDGFNFIGWYRDANYTGEKITSITEVTGDIVLFAKWEEAPDVPVECVHVDANDDNKCDICDEPFSDGETVVPEPEYEYTVTYMDGNTPLTLSPTVYTYGVGAELPLYSKDHYNFLGWYTTPTFDEGTKIETISATQTGNLTLYARMEIVNYTIEYVLQGGTNNTDNPTTYTVLSADSIELKNPTREGYSFHGWYTSPFYTEQVTELDGMTGNIVLYAKWVQKGQSGVLTPEDTFD